MGHASPPPPSSRPGVLDVFQQQKRRAAHAVPWAQARADTTEWGGKASPHLAIHAVDSSD
jgi:hypothetical protein